MEYSKESCPDYNSHSYDNSWWKNTSTLFAGRFNIVAAYRGGMSEVLICKDKYNARLVAAKTSHFRTDLFSREARLWLGLGNHPNIVKAHTVFACETCKSKYEQFLFMDFIGDEYGNSRNLRRGLLEATNKHAFILKTACSILNALEHARSVFPNFVHRDLKPENILVDNSGNILVTDFGIGHIRHDRNYLPLSDCSETPLVQGDTIFHESGSFIGTYGYAAPEQYYDSSSVTLKTDIYSLGVILHEMLTGKLPYSIQQIRQQGYQILSLPIPAPSGLSARDSLLWKIILKMLSYNPANRFSSIDEIRSELGDLITDESCLRVNNGQIQVDKSALYNRIVSYIELNKMEIAEDHFFKHKKEHPFSINNNKLARDIYSKLDTASRSNFLKNIISTDISSPIQLTRYGSILIIIFLMIYFTMQNASMSQILLICLLASILFAENYINSRTEITMDWITIPGCILGIMISFVLDIFDFRTISGGFLYSMYGAILGLVPMFTISFSYELFTKREGIGGGTIKLMAMIGSWVGLLILPIMAVSIFIMLSQFLFFTTIVHALPGKLKWSNNTVSPRLYHNSNAIPSSISIALACWIVILYKF